MAESLRVKVCGITNLTDARNAVDAGAAALGFNFYSGSPRYVAPETARAIIAQLPRSVCAVGVFVDAGRDEVARTADIAALTALQFHGNEPPASCCGWSRKIIKAVRVRDADAARLALRYDVDFILVDAYVEGRLGGTGKRIGADLLAGFDRTRLILAGGLTPDNVADAVRSIRPYGVDVASGVETAPGQKDRDRMKRFIANAHAA